ELDHRQVRSLQRLPKSVGHGDLWCLRLVSLEKCPDSDRCRSAAVREAAHPVRNDTEDAAVRDKLVILEIGKGKRVLLRFPRALVLSVARPDLHQSPSKVTRISVRPSITRSPLSSASRVLTGTPLTKVGRSGSSGRISRRLCSATSSQCSPAISGS